MTVPPPGEPAPPPVPDAHPGAPRPEGDTGAGWPHQPIDTAAPGPPAPGAPTPGTPTAGTPTAGTPAGSVPLGADGLEPPAAVAGTEGPVDRARQRREGGVGLALTVVAFLLGFVGAAIGGLVGALVAGLSPADLARIKTYPPALLAGTLIGQWIGWLALPVAFSILGGRGGPVRYFGLRMRPVDVIIGVLVGFVAQVALSYLPNLFLNAEEQARAQSVSQDLAGGGTSVAGKVVIALLIAVLTPVAEELLFRGLFFGSLRRLVPSRAVWAAILLGGVGFGFAHFSSWLPQGGKVALTGLLSLSLFGAVLCWMTVRTKRLGPAIFSHIVFNGSAVAALFFAAG